MAASIIFLQVILLLSSFGFIQTSGKFADNFTLHYYAAKKQASDHFGWKNILTGCYLNRLLFVCKICDNENLLNALI